MFKTVLKIPKSVILEVVNRRRIDNIMTKKQRGTTNNGRKILDRKQ